VRSSFVSLPCINVGVRIKIIFISNFGTSMEDSISSKSFKVDQFRECAKSPSSAFTI